MSEEQKVVPVDFSGKRKAAESGEKIEPNDRQREELIKIPPFLQFLKHRPLDEEACREMCEGFEHGLGISFVVLCNRIEMLQWNALWRLLIDVLEGANSESLENVIVSIEGFVEEIHAKFK